VATLDLLDIDDALDAVNLRSDSQNTSKVASMVTGISQHIDKLCGPVVQRSVTETYAGNRGSLLLRTTPAASITEVTETTGTTPEVLVADDYLLESIGHLAYLHRRTSGYETVWADGPFQNVSVTYVAGRFASTATVDEYWKAGARSILVQRWQREASQWSRNPNGDEYLPDGPFDVLAAIRATFPYDLLPPGIG
jgi:hypothetical protein